MQNCLQGFPEQSPEVEIWQQTRDTMRDLFDLQQQSVICITVFVTLDMHVRSRLLWKVRLRSSEKCRRKFGIPGVFGESAMRDLASKMAELKFEAPLAQFEETDEWGSTEFQSANLKNENEINNININNKKKDINDVLNDLNEDILNNSNPKVVPKTIILKNGDTASVADNFTETFSGSLEDLVNTFDDKITKCFGNYEESVENLAPVQIRSQEEIMNECQ